MKNIFRKHFSQTNVSVLIILSAFTILGACTKKNSLTSSNNNYIPLKNSEVLFTKMESYTPVLVSKGIKTFIEDAENHNKISFKKYKNLFADIFIKIGLTDNFVVFDTTHQAFKKLVYLFENSEAVFSKEKLDDKQLSLLDENIIRIVEEADNENEKTSIAFYGSFIKSLLIYYVNNKDFVESKNILLEQYLNNKTGKYEIFSVSLWGRIKCRFRKIVSGMIKGGAIGGMVGTVVPGIGTGVGAAIGGAIGGIVNAFDGNCNDDQEFNKLREFEEPEPILDPNLFPEEEELSNTFPFHLMNENFFKNPLEHTDLNSGTLNK